jgi:regulator of replication initiation timing
MLNIKSCLIVICQLIDERKEKKRDTEMGDLKNMTQKLMEEVKEIRKENHKYHEVLDKLAEVNKEIKQ